MWWCNTVRVLWLAIRVRRHSEQAFKHGFPSTHSLSVHSRRNVVGTISDCRRSFPIQFFYRFPRLWLETPFASHNYFTFTLDHYARCFMSSQACLFEKCYEHHNLCKRPETVTFQYVYFVFYALSTQMAALFRYSYMDGIVMFLYSGTLHEGSNILWSSKASTKGGWIRLGLGNPPIIC
ncbi:hypothetical protein OCU04_011989 [Sclerotinia nivalis]|uniref:Uncharacterized protein n=1 Tax=Sclerotinia nivalis TaxID=352851 RepID=A0A9X0AA11_9HELO|nr:hypothetical protein OCU04_011989 [Sclerotinia nivalis]